MKNLVLCLILLNLVFIACSKDSTNESETVPDVTAPEISISIAGFLNNAAGESIVVSNSIEINIDAKDEGGIDKIEAFLNNEKVGEDTSAPYKIIVDISSLDSKNPSSGKYKDYILKIIATDKAGNTTSKEQIINVDNQKPTITEVSLESGSVINGEENTISFQVMDNESVSSIKVYVNEEFLTEVDKAMPILNLNTLGLTDGNHTLKIEAVDIAENIGIYEVNFVSDNTGPTIGLDSLDENQIVDQELILQPVVSDEFSKVLSVELILDNSQLQFFGDTADYVFNFNSEEYETGEHIIVIKATDNLGNISQSEFPIVIYRRLLTINIPTDFYNPELARLFVFATAEDGSILDTKRIFQDTEQITLRTISNYDLGNEFSITFAEYFAGAFGNSSEFTTIQNLNGNNLKELNLKTNPRGTFTSKTILKENFDPDDEISLVAQGFGYSNFYSEEPNSMGLQLTEFTTSGHNASEIIYFSLLNYSLNEYSFLVTDNNLPSDFVLNKNDFSQSGVEQRFYQTTFNSGEYESSTLNIQGYFNEMEFQNNMSHRLYDYGYGYLPSSGIPYFMNTNFYKTRYSLRMNDYYTERTGEPLQTFMDLNWSIDYVYSNNVIDITKNSTGDILGKIALGNDSPEVINGLNISYRWNIIFDSENTSTVSLPQIPEEIQSWGFYQIYEQDNLKVQQVEIRRYENIVDYSDYLNKVIKDGTNYYLTAPVMEARFKNNYDGYYFKYPHFMLD